MKLANIGMWLATAALVLTAAFLPGRTAWADGDSGGSGNSDYTVGFAIVIFSATGEEVCRTTSENCLDKEAAQREIDNSGVAITGGGDASAAQVVNVTDNSTGETTTVGVVQVWAVTLTGDPG